MVIRPKFLDKSPNIVCHPSSTLKLAAKALEFDAKILRKEGMRNEAARVMHSARLLKSVAKGKTWAQAMCIPDGDISC